MHIRKLLVYKENTSTHTEGTDPTRDLKVLCSY